MAQTAGEPKVEGADKLSSNAFTSEEAQNTPHITIAYDPSSRLPPLSPWTHVAIFTSVLAPVALLPYLAVRRHLISLHRKVSEVATANAALQTDLRAALLETSVRREEHERLNTAFTEIRRDLERFRTEQAGKERERAKDLEHFRIELSNKELLRARIEERMKSEVDQLVAENKRIRGSMAALRDLSPSLADIAAFMHEVELQHGLMSQKNDGRGIERIRQFAYKLQSLLVAHAENGGETVEQSTPPTPRGTPGRKKAKQEADAPSST